MADSGTGFLTSADHALPKVPTGITGLDEITLGGLPKGRPTLVCGSAGCGKTLLAMEFLVRGATQYDEPGAYITFEETAEELAQNVQSLAISPWLLIPAVPVIVVIIAFNFMGDGLRDAADPYGH